MPSIFISGGAAGIGLATAERCAREGWTVGVYDYDDKALAAVKKDHPEFITGHLDVRKADEWTKALADFTSHTDGKLDVLHGPSLSQVFGNIREDVLPDAGAELQRQMLDAMRYLLVKQHPAET